MKSEMVWTSEPFHDLVYEFRWVVGTKIVTSSYGHIRPNGYVPTAVLTPREFQVSPTLPEVERHIERTLDDFRSDWEYAGDEPAF